MSPTTDGGSADLQQTIADLQRRLAEVRAEREEIEAQTTALAEVLGTINSSRGDLTLVFDAILEQAHRICGADLGCLSVYEGERFRAVATHNYPPEYAALVRQPYGAEASMYARLANGERYIHIPDVAAVSTPGLEDAIRLTAINVAGIRTVLLVPLRKENTFLGYFSAQRREVLPYSERQITLIESFAAQAVIAMENARLFGELHESLDQQTATAEILKVINSSPNDLVPVFEAMLDKATRLCKADAGNFNTYDGQHYWMMAKRNVGYVQEGPITAHPHSGAGRVAQGESIVHILDSAAEDVYKSGDPGRRLLVEQGGARTQLCVGLRKDDVLLGVMVIWRREVRPFSERQIALLQNFADQAVIAMENARLLGELRQRTDDLTESLEYQTAISELLEVISRSTSDVQPAFETILAAAKRLCAAENGGIAIRSGEVFRYALSRQAVPEMNEILRTRLFAIDRTTLIGRTAVEAKVVQMEDPSQDSEYEMPEALAIGRVKTMLGVPLMQNEQVVGVIVLTRVKIEPFSVRQIALVKTFADQAVIAMENARLLGELTRREQELSVTFENMGDGVVMFDADLRIGSWNRNFQELLDVPDSFLVGRPSLDDYVRLLVGRGEVGHGNAEEEVARYRERASLPWSTERTRPDGRTIEVRNNPIPDGGAVLIYSDITERKKTEAEIAAARDAAEAALERQTATADMLGVISRSPTDAGPVFEAIARNAHQLCGAVFCGVVQYDGEWVHIAALHGFSAEVEKDVRSKYPVRPEDSSVLSTRVITSGRAQHIENILSDNQYDQSHMSHADHRRMFGVPMLRNGKPIGAIVVAWREPGTTPQAQIDLLTTFAAQAVIAIQNVRLFTELRDSLERLKAAQANLIQAEKMASLGQLTAGIAHEIKNPLNFVNNFAGLSSELIEELKQGVEAVLAEPDDGKRAELQDTMDLLSGNLAKIVEHGRRADGIVKSMLAHSRGGSGDWQTSNINGLVEEALNLAYHGARAQDQNFNVTLDREFGVALAPIDVVPQDITRVFLNLFGNGFYATRMRKAEDKADTYQPTLRVSTRDLGEAVEVRVRDNGIGIAPEVRDKLFQPFFTTKPTGEGTGLGLSISYEIITQQHGGSIEVESEVGQFAEFTVRFPRARRAASRGSGQRA